MGVLLLSGCGNTGKSAVAAASSTSASEISNEAGKGTKVSQPAENVDAQVAEASLPQPGEAISASLAWKSRMELAYATQFAVDTYEDADGMQYEAVSVADGSRFLLIPEGGKVPEDLPDSIQVLKRPVKQIYLVATATMDMFRMLGALPDIRFSGTDASGWYIPEAKEAMENGSILYAGKYSEPDYERIVSEGCGLAIENTMILHSPEVKEKLESFGIPVLVDHSSYEAHPLGRTEWIRLYGVLTGKEKEAEAAFAKQEAALQRVTEEGSDAENAGGSVKTEQTAQAEKPSAAFFYITNQGSVNVRRSSDYIPKMIELADAYIALPGGPGTLDELSDIISLQRIHINENPCILYDIDGFYQQLKAFFEEMQSSGFAAKEDFNRVLISKDLSEIETFIQSR